MELLHLKYFQSIAQWESVTQAADELHVSQPALSKILLKLEREVGMPLFDRRNRRLYLNAAGKIFLSHVQQIFHELQLAKKNLALLAGEADSSVFVASTSSRLLPNLLTTYLREYPRGSFQMRQITEMASMQKELLAERIDFFLAPHPLAHKGIESEKLAREDIFLAVASDHPLAKRKFVELWELRQEKMISLTSECGLRELMNDFCGQAGFSPDIQFEINSLEVIANLVCAGFGVAFVPAFWREYRQEDGLVQIPIRKPACYRDVWLSYRKAAAFSAAQKRFLNFVHQYFQRYMLAQEPIEKPRSFLSEEAARP